MCTLTKYGLAIHSYDTIISQPLLFGVKDIGSRKPMETTGDGVKSIVLYISS